MDSTYKAVIDITGFDFDQYRKAGLEKVGLIVKRDYEKTFVLQYNHFTDLINPKYPELNAEWDKIESSSDQTYEEWMRKKMLELIDNDETFKTFKRAGLCEYDITDQCQFVLVLPDHNVRMSCHLEQL